MTPIHLIPLANGAGAMDPGLNELEHLAAGLARVFHTPCQIRPDLFDISFSWEPQRGQYYSSAIIQRLERSAYSNARVLGVTSCDLFVPVLTFVFGEAQLEGNCAVVSTARLKEEFYGLPRSEERIRERLLKEAAHELGHTFGLRHCMDWSCVMASSHSVELLDVKNPEFCPACRRPVAAQAFM